MPASRCAFLWSKGDVPGCSTAWSSTKSATGDWASEQHGVTVLVDAFSAQYLRGTVVDFSAALTGGGFKISNPNAKQSCGCGKSFEV